MEQDLVEDHTTRDADEAEHYRVGTVDHHVAVIAVTLCLTLSSSVALLSGRDTLHTPCKQSIASALGALAV